MFTMSLVAVPGLSLGFNLVMLNSLIGLTVYSFRKANPYLFVFLGLSCLSVAASVIALLGLLTESTVFLLMSVGLLASFVGGGILFGLCVAAIKLIGTIHRHRRLKAAGSL